MFDPYVIRKDFPMIQNNKEMSSCPMVYFDNAATTFKPQCVIDAEMGYYQHYTANTHRGDYPIAEHADRAYDEAREKVAKFINAKKTEVVFTSGTSEGLNQIANGLKKFLTKGDEVIISLEEHASNVLPWFSLQHEIGIVIKYVPVDSKGRITLEGLKSVISNKTKVVSLAHVSNTLGYVIDIKSLAKLTHEYGAYFVCDAAQSAPHMKIDVKDLDVDFLVFSGHKCVGPTGIGVMYGKYALLDKMDPLHLGGGMNTDFDMCGNYGYLITPTKFEAGTQNIAGAIGLGAALEYLDNIGLDNIEKYEHELKQYAIDKLKDIPELTIYNADSESGIITFNYKGVHAQDMGTLLASKGICVRSGQHCAKLLHNIIGELATVRASLYFYNTKEEIDQFVEACKKGGDFLDAFFA
jgi:cysteine desulfurase / selenocysteine lyase